MSAVSVIGSGTVVRGNVRGEGSVEIQGRVEGDVVVSGDVTLGEGSAVRGSISGAQLSIAGAVQGDLRGTEVVLLERGARVVGDLSAPRIGVAPGALVRGNVRTDGEAPLAPPGRRPGALGQPLRASGVAAAATVKPVSPPKAEIRPEPVVAKAPPPVVAEPEEESVPPPPAGKRAEPPPPVVPALGKNAKAKKKRRDA